MKVAYLHVEGGNKIPDHGEGGIKNSEKCDDVFYECSLGENSFVFIINHVPGKASNNFVLCFNTLDG